MSPTTTASSSSSSSSQVPSQGGQTKAKAYPFWLGGCSASIAALFTHPLDLTKTRMQTSTSKQGMLPLLLRTAKDEGLRGLYVGLSASLLRQMTYSVTRFGVYDKLKELSTSPSSSRSLDGTQAKPEPLPAYKMLLFASIAGAAGGVAGNPADIILVRMTSDVNKPPDQRYAYRNSIQGLHRMVVQEGASSLLRGLNPNLVRAVLMNASQLATYDFFKTKLVATGLLEEGTALHFSASFLAGTVATTVCSPADVVKSRIMNAASSSGGRVGAWTVLKDSLSKEGPSFLFRGWTPAWMRLSPNTIIVFVVLEKLRSLVDYVRSD
ncbi:mitochondrial carrier [Violaceomyces palustris]|uniref:Mitochondrial carrier n=1 Tax=Violaceomyces palustris TaxID=1673888 RepID=A0ACD0P275_9BASI|nr:mitochondrial carrier [Violaceomyces palustris]